MFLEDLFGRGGSSNQGTPESANPGDGAKGAAITDWLGRITGAYNSVIGAGSPKGPAPAAAKLTETKSNTALYVGLAVAGLLVAFLFFRKR
jgi:LPXTG-motif cell wall-anchored protein